MTHNFVTKQLKKTNRQKVLRGDTYEHRGKKSVYQSTTRGV
jgi:hypothetical protein